MSLWLVLLLARTDVLLEATEPHMGFTKTLGVSTAQRLQAMTEFLRSVAPDPIVDLADVLLHGRLADRLQHPPDGYQETPQLLESMSRALQSHTDPPLAPIPTTQTDIRQLHNEAVTVPSTPISAHIEGSADVPRPIQMRPRALSDEIVRVAQEQLAVFAPTTVEGQQRLARFVNALRNVPFLSSWERTFETNPDFAINVLDTLRGSGILWEFYQLLGGDAEVAAHTELLMQVSQRPGVSDISKVVCLFTLLNLSTFILFMSEMHEYLHHDVYKPGIRKDIPPPLSLKPADEGLLDALNQTTAPIKKLTAGKFGGAVKKDEAGKTGAATQGDGKGGGKKDGKVDGKGDGKKDETVDGNGQGDGKGDTTGKQPSKSILREMVESVLEPANEAIVKFQNEVISKNLLANFHNFVTYGLEGSFKPYMKLSFVTIIFMMTLAAEFALYQFATFSLLNARVFAK